MKCTIQWITSEGKLTPDDNEAVGIAYVKAHVLKPVHQSPGCNPNVEESDHYPICRAHLDRVGTNPADFDEWIFIPFKASV